MFTVMFNQAPAKDPLWTRMMSKVDDEKSDSETIEFKPLDISHVELADDTINLYTSDEGGFYFVMSRGDADKIAKVEIAGVDEGMVGTRYRADEIEIIDKATAAAIAHVREYIEAVREAPLFWEGLDHHVEFESWVLCNQDFANDPEHPIEAVDHVEHVKKAKELYESHRDDRATANENQIFGHVANTILTWAACARQSEYADVANYLIEVSDAMEPEAYKDMSHHDIVQDYLTFREMVHENEPNYPAPRDPFAHEGQEL
jgi:hypothetical protein